MAIIFRNFYDFMAVSMAIVLKKIADEDVGFWIWKKALLIIQVAPLDTIFSYSTILYHLNTYSQ